MGGFSWYSVTKHAVIAYTETLREELKRGHSEHEICVSCLVPAFVATNIRKNSALQLKHANDEKQWAMMESEWAKTKMGQMVTSTEISVEELADVVWNGLRDRKEVIPTHLDWHAAVIKDRMQGLLDCTKDKKTNMRKAVRARMAKYKQSKL